LFGRLPARFDLEVGEQAGAELGRPPPRFYPDEPAGQTIEYQG
jgi:hypothetical protein